MGVLRWIGRRYGYISSRIKIFGAGWPLMVAAAIAGADVALSTRSTVREPSASHQEVSLSVVTRVSYAKRYEILLTRLVLNASMIPRAS